jgi:hypothetical protein
MLLRIGQTGLASIELGPAGSSGDWPLVAIGSPAWPTVYPAWSAEAAWLAVGGWRIGLAGFLGGLGGYTVLVIGWERLNRLGQFGGAAKLVLTFQTPPPPKHLSKMRNRYKLAQKILKLCRNNSQRIKCYKQQKHR